MKLNELAVGNIELVADKLIAALTRRTGVQFKIKRSIMPYHNRWGKFLGRLFVTPDKHCFRLNFIRQGGTDDPVSIEYWGKGKNIYKDPPSKIFSFEGFKPLKVFFQVEAFIKRDFRVDESTGLELGEAVLQEETVKELFGMYAADNPGVIADILKGGFDEADMFAKLKVFISAKKLKVLGLSKNTLAAAIKSYLAKVAKGEVPSTISASQAAQAANAVPVAKVIPGVAEGVNTIDSDIYDVLNPALANKVNNLIAEINNTETGAFGVIRRYESQLRLATARNTGARLVVACGRAGTGKTFTTKKFLQYGKGMGLSPGSGYVEAPSIRYDDEDDVTGLFCLYKDFPIIIFDDADQLFVSRSVGVQNVMKHVLDPDRANRVLNVPKDINCKAGKVLAGEYLIDCKLIWCTNKGPNELTPAVLDRMMTPANVFNFTDQEILDMVKVNLSDLYDEFPDLSQDEIFDVFMYYQDVINNLAKNGNYNKMDDRISFRKIKEVLDKLETYKLIGEPVGTVWKELADSFKIAVKKPAQIIAEA